MLSQEGTNMLSREEVLKIKKKYKAGMKVKCLQMDDSQAVPNGTTGVVSYVDDAGQIHMNWSTGSTLALIEGVDKFCIVKTMYEVLFHSELDEEETTTTCEIRKVEFSDDTKSGEVSFWMSGKYDEDISFAYDTLDEVFDMLDSKGDISEINIRQPGEGIQIVAVNGEPVKPMFLDWTEEELEELEKLEDYINEEE